MFYCIAYDISNDRQRRKVHIWCKQTGLCRIQKSLFLGTSTHALISDFEKNVRALIPPTDLLSIMIFDKATFRNIIHVGTGTNLPAKIPTDLAADISFAMASGKKFTFKIY